VVVDHVEVPVGDEPVDPGRMQDGRHQFAQARILQRTGGGDEPGAGAGPVAGTEQGHVVAPVDQAVHQRRGDQFETAVSERGQLVPRRHHHRDVQWSVGHGYAVPREPAQRTHDPA
jgi:hypothetical protein